MDMYFTDLIYTSCCLFDGKQYILLLYLFLCPSLASYNLFFFLSYFSLRVSRGGKFTKSFFFFIFILLFFELFSQIKQQTKGTKKQNNRAKPRTMKEYTNLKATTIILTEDYLTILLNILSEIRETINMDLQKKKENQRK